MRGFATRVTLLITPMEDGLVNVMAANSAGGRGLAVP